MAKIGITKALSQFFNVDGGTGSLHPDTFGKSSKRTLPEFRDELKALTDDEKRELALMACAATGDTLD